MKLKIVILDSGNVSIAFIEALSVIPGIERLAYESAEKGRKAGFIATS
jgi:hypothetical protein